MHVDEGTIHAWLDGELPEGEAANVAAHVAGCAECSAMVAEARGLIAASHRIVASLDDVPAGVTPAARPQPSSVLRRRRSWWQRPQLAAAAALLMVAVGTWGVIRETGSPNDMPVAADLAMPAPAPELMDSAALTPQRQAAPPASVTPVQTRRAAAADQATTGAAQREVANEAKAVAAPPPPAAPGPDTTRRELAKTAPSVAADSSPRVRLADSIIARERERLPGEVRQQNAVSRAASSRGAEGAAMGAAAALGPARFDSRARAPRCFDLKLSDAARGAGVPQSVELTYEPLMGVPLRTLYLARASGQQPWFWSLTPAGAVTLVRVENNRVAYEVAMSIGGTGDVVGTERGCGGR